MDIKRKNSKEISKVNVISMLKKLIDGTIVILFVGVCAFLSLLFMMRLI